MTDVTYNQSPSFPREKTCRFCKKRKPTIHWGDAMSLVHGGSIDCCDICALEKQIDHAKEMAAKLPELEKELAATYELEKDTNA